MRPYRMGLVGGGGGFFGLVHYRAGGIDPSRRVVAGVLSSNPERAMQYASEWGLDYGFSTLEEMIAAKTILGLDYMTVAAPNFQHAPCAIPIINAGIPLLLEKPLAGTLTDGIAIVEAARQHKVPVLLAHTYIGNPMVQFAHHLIKSGAIGTIRGFKAWYMQGWLADPLEDEGQRQAQARTTPEIAGVSNCGADIWSHAEMLVRMLTGQSIIAVNATLSSHFDRPLDDNIQALVQIENGTVGTIEASQIDRGEMNHHGCRIMGSEGSIEWDIERHEELILDLKGMSRQIIRRNYGGFPEEIASLFRLPSGHPEGLHDWLGNCHRGIENILSETPPFPDLVSVTAEQGLSTLLALNACIESNKESRWVEVQDVKTFLAAG